MSRYYYVDAADVKPSHPSGVYASHQLAAVQALWPGKVDDAVSSSGDFDQTTTAYAADGSRLGRVVTFYLT